MTYGHRRSGIHRSGTRRVYADDPLYALTLRDVFGPEGFPNDHPELSAWYCDLRFDHDFGIRTIKHMLSGYVLSRRMACWQVLPALQYWQGAGSDSFTLCIVTDIWWPDHEPNNLRRFFLIHNGICLDWKERNDGQSFSLTLDRFIKELQPKLRDDFLTQCLRRLPDN